MKIFDLDRWEEIWVTITRNKWRTFITAMGVFWGMFLLVILLGAGLGLERSLFGSITMSTNSVMFYCNPTSVAYKGLPKVRYWMMNYYDIEKIKNDVEGLEYLSRYTYDKNDIRIVAGQKSTNATIKGYEPEQLKIDPLVMLYGRFINELDVSRNRKSCSIGESVYKSLFPDGGDPCGETIIIGHNLFTILGVHKPISLNGMSRNSAEQIFIPISTLQKIYNLGEDIYGFMITAKSGYSAAEIERKIDYRLRQLYSIAPDDSKAIFSFNLEEQFKKFENLFRGISLLTWIVGLGTLLAGVIGVSNIMLIVVKERTQEIGVRRALGANPMDIISQIMSESFVIIFVTGVMALAAGVGVLSLAEAVTGASSQISFGMAAGIALIIIVSGFIAGIIPTIRAIRIKAVDAIREE